MLYEVITRIREWHILYGDDVILQCPFFEEEAHASKQELRQRLEADWSFLQEAFPWAVTKVAGRGKIYNEVIEVLEELGFQGMWGYCWEQVWWDGITHKGIPWGSWYVDSSRFNAPHAGKGQIVACEWTARDLHLAYHTESVITSYSIHYTKLYEGGESVEDNYDKYLQQLKTLNLDEVLEIYNAAYERYKNQ